MKAARDILKKPTIDVRHHIDHDGLKEALGYVFTVKGNEDGTGGDGTGGAGDGTDSGGGAGTDTGSGPTGDGASTGGSTGGAANSSDGISGGVAAGGEIGGMTDYGGSPTSDPLDPPPAGFDTPPDENYDLGPNEFDAETFGSPTEGTDVTSEGTDAEIPFIDAIVASTLSPTIEPDRPRQFATREQTARRRATGAGAVRSDNMADLLGYASGRRRTGAARAILGSR